LVNRLTDASAALGELAGLARNLSNTSLLISPFMRREAVLSSRIEGTETGIVELYAYEAGQQLTLALPGAAGASVEADRQEVSNYVQALQYGLDRLRDLPCSLRLLREIHERLLRGVRGAQKTPGEFRRIQNWIASGDRAVVNATFVPPPIPEMEVCLHEFEHYLHSDDDLPPLVRLAMIHYQFEVIHPFLDGNGRLGRLLIVLLLVSWGLLPAPLLYLSAYLERNREEYYRQLLAVSQKGTIVPWVEFFLAGVAEQSRDATSRAKRLQDLQENWRESLTAKRASTLGPRLADSLFKFPVITIPLAMEILGVSYQSAKDTVLRLVAVGILQEISAPPGAQPAAPRLFWAKHLLEIIDTE
jgi:Fic family protein